MAGDIRIERWGVPKPSRLETARDTARRMLESTFREGLVTDPEGKHRIIIAEADDSMGEVFTRYYEVGSPVTFSVRVGSLGLVLITMSESESESEEKVDDEQVCTEATTFGMVISLLLTTGKPIRLNLKEPDRAGYQLAFA